MGDDRCFCGAEWNDVAEGCVDGHPFGEEERLRAALRAILKVCADDGLDPLGRIERIALQCMFRSR